MKIKIVDTNLDVRPNLSPYFIQSIYDYYIGRMVCSSLYGNKGTKSS